VAADNHFVGLAASFGTTAAILLALHVPPFLPGGAGEGGVGIAIAMKRMAIRASDFREPRGFPLLS
jgi:hypothetical protein